MPRKVISHPAESVAIQALSYLAEDTDRLGRFLAITGMDPRRIRAAAAEPDFLAGVLEYVSADEPLLVAFAEHAGLKPQDVEIARAALAGGPWQRDVP
jgi:hypothetical protein